MSKKLRLALMLAATLPAGALADGYVGVNYVSLTYANDDLAAGEEEIELGDLMLRLGGNISPYWVMELRGGTTAAAHEVDAGGEYRHHLFYGVMARFQWPLGSFVPYASAGQSWFEVSLDGADDFEFDDTSFAAGLDIRLGDALGLNLEYARAFKQDDFTGEAPSVGLFYAF